jgi:hypothetical protein
VLELKKDICYPQESEEGEKRQGGVLTLGELTWLKLGTR